MTGFASAAAIPAGHLSLAVKGTLSRQDVPARYRAGILMAASAMLLLPALYLMLSMGMALATGWHVIRHVEWLTGTSARWWSALGYIGLGGAGLIQSLFMLKPLFAVTRRDPREYPLSPDQEPELYAFVRKVCAVIGAPVPRRILLNTEINAYARYAGGSWNVILGRVELVFGLSLVAGLSLQQFACVLAHELAHFGQGAAIRLIYVVRAVNNWFEEAVYGRDAWDAWLERWAQRMELGVGFIFLLARASLWTTRQALKPFMLLGQFLSCYLLRQMELDADRYAVRLAGVETFESLLVRTRILGAAHGMARKTLSLSWQEGRLADDFPSLVLAHTRVFIPEVRQKIEKELWNESRHLLQTHPPFAERVRAARALGCKGLCRLNAEATGLFVRFKPLSRLCTLLLYAHDLPEESCADRLTSTDEIMRGQSQIQAGEAALESYFFGLLSWMRPLFIDGEAVRGRLAPEEAAARLTKYRRFIEAGLPGARTAFAEFVDQDQRLLYAVQAGALMRAGFEVDPEDFLLEGFGAAHAERVQADCRTRQSAAGERLEALEEAFAGRLTAALQALPALVEAGKLRDGAEFLEECREMLPVLECLKPAFSDLLPMRRDFAEMLILVDHLQGNERSRALGGQIASLAVRLHRRLESLRNQLRNVPVPFRSGPSQTLSLSELALDVLPDEGDYEAVFDAADKAMARLNSLYLRIMGQLALIAGSVEGALELGPMRLPHTLEPLPDLRGLKRAAA